MKSGLNLAWPIILSFLIIMGWMPFEGNFWFVITVGLLLTLLWAFVFFRQSAWLRSYRPDIRLAAFGGMVGFIAPAVILALMVLKTGIHSHGPEFTPVEISWVARQFLIWPIVAAGLGLGFGLILASKSAYEEG